MIKRILGVVYMALIYSSVTFAAHPLITDDTGTQGKDKYQLEVNSEFSYDKEREDADDDGVEDTVKVTGGELATILSYGLTDNIDIVLGLPYAWSKTEINGVVDSDDPAADTEGISDISVEAKWRFFDKDGLSFAIKPGITLPTGDENKGLGNGRASYGLVFIATKEIKPWAFHMNLGYTHNEYKIEADKDANRKGIWHVSLASEVEVMEDLKAVANIGIERNSDKASNTHPAFFLSGLIYSISENIAVDFGIKAGFNRPETDLTFLAGMAFKF